MIEILQERATNLLEHLIAKVEKGDPKVCTYSFVHKHMLLVVVDRWLPSYATEVINIARDTPEMLLPGLGNVHLDTFIVAKDTGKPGEGHWDDVTYNEEDWNRVLGKAQVID